MEKLYYTACKLFTHEGNTTKYYCAGSYWTQEIEKAMLYGDKNECERIVRDMKITYKYYIGHEFVVGTVALTIKE